MVKNKKQTKKEESSHSESEQEKSESELSSPSNEQAPSSETDEVQNTTKQVDEDSTNDSSCSEASNDNEKQDDSTSVSEAANEEVVVEEIKAGKRDKSKKVNEQTESSDDSTEAEKDEFNSAGKTVFMKNFSGDITEEEIREALEKLGEIHELRVPKKREHKKTRGFLICCFKERKALLEAMKLNDTTFLDCKIYVEELKDGLKKRSDHKEERSEKREYNKRNEGERATAFVGNLPYEVDEYAFKKYIEGIGNIRNIRIPQDKETGRKRGFAFFEFNDKSDMEKMMKKNLIWDDRKLFMRESEERRDDGNRNDRGRGNGRDMERSGRRDGGDRRNNNRDGDRKNNSGDGDRRGFGGDRRNNNMNDNNDRGSFDKNKDRKPRYDKAEKENSKKIKFEDSDS